MNAEERKLIAGLFERLRGAEGAYRDPEAESFIASQVDAQPHAPYALAQTVIVQNQSLEAAKTRIAELEDELERHRSEPEEQPRQSPWGQRANEAMGAPGGFGAGGGTFGRQGYESARPYGAPYQQDYQQPAAGRGGGFLSGALQTAAGVAGGALLFEGIRSMFGGGDEAKAGGLSGDAAHAVDADKADVSPGDSQAGADAGEGGWFSGLLDGVGDNRSASAPTEDPGDSDAGSGDDGDWT